MEQTQMEKKASFIKSTRGIIILSVAALAVGFFGGMEYKAYKIRTDIELGTYQTTQSLMNVGKALDKEKSAQRDAQRFAEVRQFMTALELYFYSNNSRYPGSLNDLVSTFLSRMTNAPSPADGNCTEDQNTYTYKFISDTKYSLTFCLGGQTEGYSGGQHTATPAGIQ